MLFQQAPSDPLSDACGDTPSWLCERVLDATDSEGWATTADVLLARPATIVLVVAVAWLVNRLISRAIRRFTDGIATPESTARFERFKQRAPAALVDTGTFSLRSAARAQTLAQVLQSIAAIIVWTTALVTILGQLGVNLGPLLAGAGVAGVAIGFGAQSLVKDFFSGIFMLVEDQYGVGDIVDIGEAEGTVEAISLRITRLRGIDGTVWHVPNGAIARVGNMSQQWARALLDISVAYGTDIDHAEQVIKDVADGLWSDLKWRGKVLESPEVWGVQELAPDAIVLRLVIKTRPSEQFMVMREIRARLMAAFPREGIEVPTPRGIVWVRRDPGSSRDVAEMPDAAEASDRGVPSGHPGPRDPTAT